MAQDPRNHRSAESNTESLTFTNNLCSRFKAVKKFTPKTGADRPPITTSFDYNDTGKYLVTASTEGVIHLYDAINGTSRKTIQSRKYGCDLTRFTHSDNSVLHASTIDKPIIRLLNIETGDYVRYFDSHRGTITSMELSPSHDLFISAARDDSIRLWDVRASNEQGFVPLKGTSKLAFDPSGMVMCASSVDSSRAALYDLRNIEGGHFTEFMLPAQFLWNKVEFSNDNKFILFSCINGDSAIFDAFTGEPSCRLSTGTVPPSAVQTHGSAAFTPDGKYVFAATFEGHIGIYDLKGIDPITKEIPSTLSPFFQLPSDSPRNIIFNPMYMQFCTGDINTYFWLPQEF